MTDLERPVSMPDHLSALIDVAEHMDADVYSVHGHKGSDGFSVMLTFTNLSGIFRVRDKLRGLLQ